MLESLLWTVCSVEEQEGGGGREGGEEGGEGERRERKKEGNMKYLAKGVPPFHSKQTHLLLLHS